MKKLKNSLSSIILCLFEILVGVLLLMKPVEFAKGIIIAAGAILILLGLINAVKYFKTNVEEAAGSQYLTIGLLALLAGIFCVIKAGWIVAAVSALTLIYGVVILVTGLSKVQLTCDMLRKRNKKWFLALISAAVSIICAVIIINNPFATTAGLWIFAGIVLIAESILDIVTIIFEKKGNPAPAEVAEKKDTNELAD
ncbi:MAG: DUF308 domain-containing protein [Ruminococcaceae bacterium]|nr:DUF308 domain-containing protein [Oscillospiraceae bacterium]